MALPRRRQGDHHFVAAGGGGAGHNGGTGRKLSLRSGFGWLAIVFGSVAVANMMIYYGTGKGLMSSESAAAAGLRTEDLTVMSLARSMSEYAYGGGAQNDGVDASSSLSSSSSVGPPRPPLIRAAEPTKKPIGSQVDLDDALRKTNERIKQGKEEAVKEEERRRKEEDDRKKKEEDERRKKLVEEEDKKKQVEEEKRKKEEEGEKRKRDEEEGKRKAADEDKRKKEEEEGRRKKEAEAAAASDKKKEEETKKEEPKKEEAKKEEKAPETATNTAVAVPPGKPLTRTTEELKKEPIEQSRTRFEALKKQWEEDKSMQPRVEKFFNDAKAETLAWPTSGDMSRSVPEGDLETGVILPVKPAKGVHRKPITPRPPLHRPRNETEIEKLLIMISSTDRGQRINHLWSGDKIETMKVTMASLTALCERGFEVTAWFVAAWQVSAENDAIRKALYCERIKDTINIKYWDHFPHDIEGRLSSRHRLVVKEAKDDYDFFISIEDDIHLRPIMFDAFVDASNRLARANDEQDSDQFFPGFSRVEHDPLDGDQWSTWETDIDDYQAALIPGSGWFAKVGGNVHQAMWMATREQIYHLDDRCDEHWFSIDEAKAVWVEWWSGAPQLWSGYNGIRALQLWSGCKGISKVIPVSTLRYFTVWHMTDTKLYYRGKGVGRLHEIEARMKEQRERKVGTAEEVKEERKEEGEVTKTE